MSIWNDLWDCFRECLLPTLAVCFVAILAVGPPIYLVMKASCEQQTQDFESRFGLFTECQVEVNGRWQQWDNYRATEETTNE